MQKITKAGKVSRSAIVVPLETKRSALYLSRCATIVRMSGYPSALHSIGRLQRVIDLSSYKAMLTSIHKLQQLVYVTAEVILTMEGTKVDKFQINKTEIMTYAKNIVTTMRNVNISDDDLDIIANLIISFEANPGAWVLTGAGETGSRHVQFQKMYKSVLTGPITGELAMYAAHDDTIKTISSLDQFTALATEKVPTGVRQPDEGDKLEQDNPSSGKEGGKSKSTLSDQQRSFIVLQQFAATRVIDHVYQLLMDKDVWYNFVSPRTRADVATNIERAKSLKVFSLYLQSLLTYHQYFTIEMYMKSYELVQDWIAHFPPLEPTVINNLEKTIRSHDMLNAKGDVEQLMSSFAADGEAELGVVVFPREFLSTYGFVSAVDAVSKAAGSFSLTGDLENLSALDDPRYLPLTSGSSVSAFDVTYTLAMILLKKKIIGEEVENALINLVPSLTRGAAKAAIEGLRSLNIRASLEFRIPHAATYSVEAGAVKCVQGGRLHLDSGAPSFSYDYHQFVRKDLKFKMTTDFSIAKTYKDFSIGQIPDFDRAAELRDILSYQWKTLVPSAWVAADRVITADKLKGNEDDIKALVENISGMSYEIAIMQLSLAHVQKIWATYLSSFCLLYTTDEDTVPLSDYLEGRAKENGKMKLVNGHGKPYGTTYVNLEMIQGTLTPETPLIPIGRGKFIRFLSQIPVVVDELRADTTPFYSERPVMYFASNSVKQTVTHWAWSDGLVNFAMMPSNVRTFVPSVKFTPKFAFYNMNLYLNMDINFRPQNATPAREVTAIDIVTSDWPYDVHQYFLKYNHFGPYAKPAAVIPGTDEQEMVADAIKKIESSIKEDDKQQADLNKEAGTKQKEVAKEVTDEIKKTKKPETDASDESDPVVI